MAVQVKEEIDKLVAELTRQQADEVDHKELPCQFTRDRGSASASSGKEVPAIISSFYTCWPLSAARTICVKVLPKGPKSKPEHRRESGRLLALGACRPGPVGRKASKTAWRWKSRMTVQM